MTCDAWACIRQNRSKKHWPPPQKGPAVTSCRTAQRFCRSLIDSPWGFGKLNFKGLTRLSEPKQTTLIPPDRGQRNCPFLPIFLVSTSAIPVSQRTLHLP